MSALVGIDRQRKFAEQLQQIVSTFPQVEIETKHYFANGVYCREIYIPRDFLIVGKVHKAEHFAMISKGRLRVTTHDGVREFEGPHLMVSPGGTKRVLLALTDVIFMNIHRTDSRDLDAIEKELIEDDETALFDSANRLKVRKLERI
jgi:hypothetical protein